MSSNSIVSKFNFVLEYHASSSNHITYVIIQWANLVTIYSLVTLSGSDVITNTRFQIWVLLENDLTTPYLVDLIKQGKTQQFWLDEGPVKTKRKYVCTKWWRFEEILNFSIP